MPPTPYIALEATFKRLYNFTHLLSLASWDMDVMMPPKGADARSDAIAELKQVCHSLLTSAETNANLKAACESQDALDEVQLANLREMRMHIENECKVPDEFVQRRAKLTASSRLVWVKARAENDFSIFLPSLKAIIDISREEARYRQAGSTDSPYEALFHMYEPGLSLARVDAVFQDVKTWLPQLLRDVLEVRKGDPAIVPPVGPLAFDKQEALSRAVMSDIFKFDFDAGRLDVSAHAFTGMTKEDTRLTSHYDEKDYADALFATVHETGHAKYEMNCGPRHLLGQPVCEARSLSVHESQSLFQEMQIGRSASFAEMITPYLKQHLGDQEAFSVANVRLINQHVEPGYIRVAADEVCYPLHVILRYEIERALIEGTMEAEDVPRVWNEKMQEYLGLSTEGNDKMGCLQDIHWSLGYMGYFPTYSLGAMFAAQLMATVKLELGEDVVEDCIRTGKMDPIFAIQKAKIWDQGCLRTTEELMEKATGETLNPRFFREHLERRYLRREN